MVCSASHAADGLIGKWRCEALTNATVEFSTNGIFHLNAVDRVGDREIVLPMTGTYRIVDTNHVVLQITPAPTIAPSNSVPVTLSYSLSGDELELQTLDVKWGVRKYRRIRN